MDNKWGLLKKFKVELRHDQAVPLWGICMEKKLNQSDIHTHTHTHTHTHIYIYTVTFIAALFTIAKTCNQPKCPPIDEWIKKDIYIYMMAYYIYMAY